MDSGSSHLHWSALIWICALVNWAPVCGCLISRSWVLKWRRPMDQKWPPSHFCLPLKSVSMYIETHGGNDVCLALLRLWGQFHLNRPWKNVYFHCNLGKISLQQGRFPSSVGWFPLCISLFFPSKSQNFQARSFPFCQFFPHLHLNSPVSQYERPARLCLPVPHVSTKPLKSSLSLHAKIPFYVWNEWIKYCKRYHYEVNRSVLHVNCLCLCIWI